jgi:hypothetical protein
VIKRTVIASARVIQGTVQRKLRAVEIHQNAGWQTLLGVLLLLAVMTLDHAAVLLQLLSEHNWHKEHRAAFTALHSSL